MSQSRLIGVVISLLCATLVIFTLERAYNPTHPPSRFTYGVAFERGYRWTGNNPTVFIRYLNAEAEHPGTAPPLAWLRDKLQLFQGREVVAQEFIDGQLKQPFPRQVSIIVTGADACYQHSKRIAGNETTVEDGRTKLRVVDKWVKVELIDLNRLSAFRTALQSVIRYVSDADPMLWGNSDLPPPPQIRMLVVQNPRHANVVCLVRIQPNRVSFSRYQMQFDIVFAGKFDYPKRVRVSPPWGSSDWQYEGGRQTQGPPKAQPQITKAWGSPVPGLVVEVPGRIDKTRSDFPSLDTALSISSPTLRVSWTYGDDDHSREFASLVIGGFVALMALIFYEAVTLLVGSRRNT